MASRDLKNYISSTISLSPAARTASANGTGVDRLNADGVVVYAKFGTWTDGTHTPSIQESDDNSTFTNVAAGDLNGAFAAVSSAGGNNTTQEVQYLGVKRYVRGVMTVAGATTGALSAMDVVLGNPRKAPI